MQVHISSYEMYLHKKMSWFLFTGDDLLIICFYIWNIFSIIIIVFFVLKEHQVQVN